MSGESISTRRWLARVRELRAREVRERDGVCYVEGIRQVVTAIETGHCLEAVFIDPQRLRSDVALAAVDGAGPQVEARVMLSTAEFERISSRENPIGIAAIVRWKPVELSNLNPEPAGLYVVADDIRDPGNLGTLIRATDAAGGAAVIVRGGTDPGHPGALRASLGTTFEMAIAVAESVDDVFGWASVNGVQTVATSASGELDLWELEPQFPVTVLVGNEGTGLSADTLKRSDANVRIPMYGSATSLNVSVAAGIVLFELARKHRH